MKTKKQLRAEIKDEILSLSEQSRLMLSADITENVVKMDEWIQSDTIGITISGEIEPNTLELIKEAWNSNKRVVVPKCHPATKTMTFHEITSFDQLEVVYFGLKEPIEALTKEVNQDEIQLLFVPGLYFTAKGYRLGHGGGYYDRYLEAYKGTTVALAFPIQFIDELPIESFDLPVNKIVTTTQVINCHE
ncbi:5-formyltetrahydrofolate cyclo-ligase [Cytobacillus luteolus]|uniref:5-formyltetrahydrofolate cyclo-ligase n=1 Tax=Litchfieldia luteola TaxID=682179 RepID=UPI001CB003E8|nr:5-formyltetrahydrofolate cyclo-ligase [Cytobacillus luteolus]